MFLYMRMLVSILVNLYTVRLLWQILGVDDYGIFNVVGGIVLLLSFLLGSMVASTQRFISFAIGRNDFESLRKIFSMSIVVHVLMAVFVVVLLETAGLWFVNARLNIPEGRMYATNWVYQCSIATFVFNILSVPYNACIVAHERMNIYGYLGILDVILKLLIVLVVDILPFDRLISYSVLLVVESGMMRIIYSVYCTRNFRECKYVRVMDRCLLKEMFSFTGWNFFGAMGISVRDQGLNILVNIFFNVAVNAAKGVATQVGSVISGFATNFTMAVNPQITKRYASGAIQSMLSLMFSSCKYSIVLMAVVVIPLMPSAETVLKLWLGSVAPYSVGFLRLILIVALIDSVINPIITALHATGKIKKFQIVISIIMIANLPIAWLWLRLDANPFIVMYVTIITSVIGVTARLWLLHELVPFPVGKFFRTVYARTLPIILTLIAVSFWMFGYFADNIWGLLGFVVCSVAMTCVVFLFFGLDRTERQTVYGFIRKRLASKGNTR